MSGNVKNADAIFDRSGKKKSKKTGISQKRERTSNIDVLLLRAEKILQQAEEKSTQKSNEKKGEKKDAEKSMQTNVASTFPASVVDNYFETPAINAEDIKELYLPEYPEYRPSAQQLKALMLLADIDRALTITDVCRAVGIDRTTFYKWLRKQEFRAYMNYLIDIETEACLRDAFAALKRQMKRGDVQAIKLYLELKDRFRPTTTQRMIVEGGDVPIQMQSQQTIQVVPVFNMPKPPPKVKREVKIIEHTGESDYHMPGTDNLDEMLEAAADEEENEFDDENDVYTAAASAENGGIEDYEDIQV